MANETNHNNDNNTTKLVVNQPYDETLSVYDDEEVLSPRTPSQPPPQHPKSKPSAMAESLIVSDDDEFDQDEADGGFQIADPPTKKSNGDNSMKLEQPKPPTMRPPEGPRPPPGGHVIEASDDDDDDDEDEEEQSESSDDDGANKTSMNPEGTYEPADYEHLPVNQEIKELFQYITRYTPQAIDLDYLMKPFVPDYIPAVGDIDAFLKVNRPDDKPETLGLQIIDEPSAMQSDPTVLDLQLRSISKQTTAKQVSVKSIPDVDSNSKAVDTWISSISDIHRSKPPQNVHYAKPMPDIEKLMQEWPPEFEELLKTTNLPSADIDCDLAEYIDLICGVLDIPVYKNRIQSLHVLFTLYSEFKNSQHFNQLANVNQLSNELKNTHLYEGKDSSQAESIYFD